MFWEGRFGYGPPFFVERVVVSVVFLGELRVRAVFERSFSSRVGVNLALSGPFRVGFG